MNNIQHQEAVKKAVKKQFRGRSTLNSKSTPLYPDNAEREYQRIAAAYVRLLNKSLKDHLPEIMAEYKVQRNDGVRNDDLRDLESWLRRKFQEIAAELEQRIASYDLRRMVEKISGITQRSSLREWKRSVKNTLGIDLLNDYYDGSFYQDILHRWIDENVTKIKSIPQNTLMEMQQIIQSGFRSGSTIRDITKAIQKEYNLTKGKARMHARDQVATLNAQITKKQQEDAGCKRYRWSDSRDSRVRDCHRSLNGQIFSWDDPPEMWYVTKKKGIVHTGRRCHPGEDYACRCVAIPVFDYDTIDLPIQEKQTKE